jgi:uncharacterized membrane protein YhhN
MTLGATLVAVGVALLLYAELTERPALRVVGKPLASAGFLAAALHAPALRLPSGSGWVLLAALVLSAAGDILLIPAERRWFLGGMGAFGLAHLAFGAWFIVNGAVSWALGVTVLVMLVLGHAAWLWLSPHVRGHMRVPVRVYVLLASLMTACALAAAVHAVGAGSLAVALPALGGVMFCVSDVAVARQQFVKPGPVNRLWGLPLYYLATLLLASAVLAR